MTLERQEQTPDDVEDFVIPAGFHDRPRDGPKSGPAGVRAREGRAT
jgi:hypothetical protein